MRRLTFQGYLKDYVTRLAGLQTRSLRLLAAHVGDSPRLTEPLVLLAVVTCKTDALAALRQQDAELGRELDLLDRWRDAGELEAMLATGHTALRPEYTKVWRSYVASRDAPERDAELKSAARARVLALEEEKSVTRYRMARDLGLNPGNLHAFLAQGNVGKLSLDRAYALVDYLEAA